MKITVVVDDNIRKVFEAPDDSVILVDDIASALTVMSAQRIVAVVKDFTSFHTDEVTVSDGKDTWINP